ncbi:MAG: leucine--tRNA ligase [Candidatus Gracilibacteria bacterium]
MVESKKYDASKVEKKWQKKWARDGLYEFDVNKVLRAKKYYNLVMFPYPSGDRLHIGHWYAYAPPDSHGRYMRMNGYDVFEPMGFDSFGLPAENYAIKTGVHPKDSIAKNVDYMIKQISNIGGMHNWDKTLSTSDPEYYKWTQWIFLQMYKNGLAYKKKQGVNWCPSCQTVLANEQVVDGRCDRCKSEVVQKELEQWFWRIRDYAERLLNYEGLDWPEKTKTMQANWIGRSKGINFIEKVKDMDIKFEVYDSVPQTFTAQTFTIIAPEHHLVPKLVKGTKYEKSVMEFVERIRKKKIANKFDIETDMEGIFTGRYVKNPFGMGDLPIWVASFVLADYGTGVVNCSAHDDRDFEFAKKYGIPLRITMLPKDPKEAEKVKKQEYCYHHVPEGIIQHPEEFKGMTWEKARKPVIDYIEKKGYGKRAVNYKLRDWLISRQRYWGAPIPIIYCKKCGEVAVPEKDLPVELPLDVEFKLRGDGKSPLAHSRKFMNVLCPKCGGAAKRESDTMDTFVCSSWYFLRYPSMGRSAKAKKVWSKVPFDKAITGKMLPVDMYIGGPEHACMHLLYARFVNMVLHDLGFIDFKEPFKRLVHQGMITKDGAKMSKSRGNVVSPDAFIEQYGSDVFRMYLMFMGPFEQGGDWSDKGIKGIARFVDKFWEAVCAAKSGAKVSDADGLKRMLHKTIKRVTSDIESFQFNTAISALMEFLNAASVTGMDGRSARVVVQLIAPIAPHLAEECFAMLGEKSSVFDSKWPKYDPLFVKESVVTYAIQVNGKMRGTLDIAADSGKEDVLKAAKEVPNVAKYLAEGKIVKEIFVLGKIVGFVVAG